MTSDAPDWRPLLAALADDDARTVFAQLSMGAPATLDGVRAERRLAAALARLSAVGILDTAGEIDGAVFARALRAAATPAKTGIDRFLRDGRIAQYPMNPATRLELLEHVATGVLRDGEVVDERELGDRLARFDGDAAALRRHLVDAGLVERTRSGSEYALASVPVEARGSLEKRLPRGHGEEARTGAGDQDAT
jgi:hypothetical protein